MTPLLPDLNLADADEIIESLVKSCGYSQHQLSQQGEYKKKLLKSTDTNIYK